MNSTALSNEAKNLDFLLSIDSKTRAAILENIAKHYGIAPAGAYEEVTGEGAESLLDYVTGAVRTATSLLWRRHGFAV